MASAIVYDAIKTHLATTFGGTYEIKDFDSIDQALEQGSAPFLVLEEAAGDEAAISFGDPSAICFREEGVVSVLAFTPTPEASGAGRTIADTVRDALRLQTLDNNVKIRSVAPPVMESLNDGIWSVISCAVTYRFDVQHAVP